MWSYFKKCTYVKHYDDDSWDVKAVLFPFFYTYFLTHRLALFPVLKYSKYSGTQSNLWDDASLSSLHDDDAIINMTLICTAFNCMRTGSLLRNSHKGRGGIWRREACEEDCMGRVLWIFLAFIPFRRADAWDVLRFIHRVHVLKCTHIFKVWMNECELNC